MNNAMKFTSHKDNENELLPIGLMQMTIRLDDGGVFPTQKWNSIGFLLV